MTKDYCWVTIGARGFNKENLERLAEYDPKGVRINTGRSSFEWINCAIETLTNAGYSENKIYLDVGNNKPRVALYDSKLNVKKGDAILFGAISCNRASLCDGAIENVPFFSSIKKDDILILGDGEIECKVTDKDENGLRLYSMSNGCITNQTTIGVKGRHYESYYISPKDTMQINYLLKQYSLGLIVSFIERKENIIECEKAFPNACRIIPKIESKTAYGNLDGIFQYSDWALLGRGDFALSVGIEKLGYYQKEILRLAKKHNCNLVVASGTLESLEMSEIPFRSEIIDITNSYFEGAAGIMLTNESGASVCPFKSINFLYHIIDYLEN